MSEKKNEKKPLNLKPGDKVIRGPDWRYGDYQDGGAGNIGTVISKEEYAGVLPGWIAVRWPNGHENQYRNNSVGIDLKQTHNWVCKSK